IGLAQDFLMRLQLGLASLGLKRLLTLGIAGIAVFTLVATSSYYLSLPQREVIYSGLDLQDVSQIGAVLEESGVPFDVNPEGTAVLVDYGNTARARMLLAEKGLPKGDKSGYELFDNLGSMGLTSFMQQITKVRALEGELARTIQLMKGIKAARVHIVMPQEGTFRSIKEPPSASVIIRTEMSDGKLYAAAIQQLVGAAIPGMTKDMVTVLSTDGSILASHEDALSAAPGNMVTLEKSLAKDIEQRVGMTLVPFLGLENFRISVTAKLNTDRRQTNETIFDPESRVERSVRTVKEQGEAQNNNSQSTVGVDQNIPTETTPTAAPDQSTEKNDKREELTNYEINSKSVATTSEGYNIEALSIAVIINKVQLAKALGGSPTPEQMAAKMTEIQSLISSASGANETRGDKIQLTAEDFISSDIALEPVASASIVENLTHNLGNLINAFALITVVLLVLLLGLRPMLRMILESKPAQPPESVPMLGANNAPSPQLPPMGVPLGLPSGGMNSTELVAELPEAGSFKNPVQQKLEDLVSRDSEKAAKILKEWLAEPKKSAA
ncbi:MAG: flagellar basal-body MS-ring/collar protein FliF, partial [Aestuariivirga sp.]